MLIGMLVIKEPKMPGIVPLNQRSTNRRAALVGSAALALCGGRFGVASGQDATPAARPTGDDDAVALLTDAATAMTELETFAFTVVTARGETTILEGFALEQVSGVVRRPTDFETTVTVAIPFASLDLTAVSIDGELWLNIPALGEMESGWQSLGSGDALLSLLNPDVLILESVQFIDDAAIDREGDIDGAAVSYVTGTVDFQAIAGDLFDGDSALRTEIAEGPVQLTIAVDDMSLVREIEIIGPLLSAESPDVIRLVTFVDFNEPVEIQEPEITPAT
jgi:hypothetical protein